MDSSANSGPACPTCGEQVESGHVCPAGAPARSEFEDTGRIQIPEALRNTGLFRAAWQPSPEQAAPETVSNIFARIEEETTVTPEDAPQPHPEEPQAPEVPVDPWAGFDVPLVTHEEASTTVDPWADLGGSVVAPTQPASSEDPFSDLTPSAPVEEVDDSPVHVRAPLPAFFDEPTTAPGESTIAGAVHVPKPLPDFFAEDASLDEAPQESHAEAPIDEISAEPEGSVEPQTNVDEVPPFEDWFAEDEAVAEPGPESINEDDLAVDTAADAADASSDESAELDPTTLSVPIPPSLIPVVAADEAATGEVPVVESDLFDEEVAPGADAPADLTEEDEAGEGDADEGDAGDDASTLSPIAAAEAAALAVASSSAVSSSSVMDETAAIDLESAFGAEQQDLEPIPEPEQSAWDLYGDSLYASEEPAAPDTSAPHEPDISFVPGLSAAGRTSATLPGSVPFAPGIGVDGAPVPETDADAEPVEERRSRKGLVAGVVALALVAGGGGWFWWNSQKDAPVKDAFATSNTSFSKASTQLREAQSIAEIAAAGEAFEQTVPALAKTAQTSQDNNSDVSVAARRAVVAQQAVAAAAGPLADLSTSDLSAWGNNKDELATSLDGLDAVKDDIETAGGSADRLPDSALIDTLQEVIAEEVVGSAARTVVDVSAKLESASLLADVRAAGASAKEYITPLTEAAAGLDDADKKASLEAVVDFHEAIAKFSTLRAGTFDTWEDLKTPADKAAEALADSGDVATVDEAKAGIKAADKLVTTSRDTYREWETKHAAAKAERAASLAGLDAAEAAAESADTAYTAQSTQLSTLLSELRSLPAEGKDGQAYAKLDAAASAREAITAQLTGLTLTPGPERKLEPLLEGIAREAEGFRAAADAAGRCTDDCRLSETAGWKKMAASTEGAAAAWDTNQQSFVDAIESARTKLKEKKLPKKPKV